MADSFLKHVLRKPGQVLERYSEDSLFPVLTVNELLPELESKQYFKKLQDLVGIPEEHFNALYHDLIVRFVEFVQVLPVYYGEQLGSLLNEGLRRGLLAVQILFDTSESRPEPLYVYTVYSLSLLIDVGKVIVTQKVMVSDEKGIFIEDWCPYRGSLLEFGKFYKLRPYGGTPDTLIRSATPLLARQLLSDAGIKWLSSDTALLDMWLACLSGGENWAGELGRFLQLIKKQFEQFRAAPHDIIPIHVQLRETLATQMGEEFLIWLREGIENGTITVNQSDSHVHIVESGIFLDTPEIFQTFTEANKKYGDWTGPYKQLNLLGIIRSGYDYKFEQFFSEYSDAKAKQTRQTFLGKKAEIKTGEQLVGTQLLTKSKNIKEGIVIKDAGLIYVNKKPPPVTQMLREIQMRWMLDNVLPKIPGAISTPQKGRGL